MFQSEHDGCLNRTKRKRVTFDHGWSRGIIRSCRGSGSGRCCDPGLFLSGSSASGTPTGKPGTPPVKPGTPPAPPQVLKGSRVLLVGDSLAVGLTPRFKTVASSSGYVPDASAQVSTTIKMWNIRLAQILQAAQPQLVLVSLGTNDSVGTVFSSEQAALDGIIKTVQDAGAVLVWIGPCLSG